MAAAHVMLTRQPTPWPSSIEAVLALAAVTDHTSQLQVSTDSCSTASRQQQVPSAHSLHQVPAAAQANLKTIPEEPLLCGRPPLQKQGPVLLREAYPADINYVQARKSLEARKSDLCPIMSGEFSSLSSSS
jgi:hypothetical protein